MITRKIEKNIRNIVEKFKVSCLIGARQTGKTTVIRHIFPNMQYLSLENLESFKIFTTDPKHFLENLNDGIILDNVELLSDLIFYLTIIIDLSTSNKHVILVGSIDFLQTNRVPPLIIQKIGIVKLLPCSLDELLANNYTFSQYEYFLFKGFYPRSYSEGISPEYFYPMLLQTILDKDFNEKHDLQCIRSFINFLKICSRKIGQPVDVHLLSVEMNIPSDVILKWFTFLEACFIIFFLPSTNISFNNKANNNPQIYFYDIGLVSYLLEITSPIQFESHPLIFNLFKNFILVEIVKKYHFFEIEPTISYFKNDIGNEIDLLVKQNSFLHLLTIRPNYYLREDFSNDILMYYEHVHEEKTSANIIYGGNNDQSLNEINVLSWRNLDMLEIFKELKNGKY